MTAETTYEGVSVRYFASGQAFLEWTTDDDEWTEPVRDAFVDYMRGVERAISAALPGAMVVVYGEAAWDRDSFSVTEPEPWRVDDQVIRDAVESWLDSLHGDPGAFFGEEAQA